MSSSGLVEEDGMSVDKAFCMSSYLSFRYIEAEGVDFCERFQHENVKPVPLSSRIPVATCEDIDREIASVFDSLAGKRLGLLLSGGMDSGCLAAYMEGADAYTFRFLGGEYQEEELERAEKYAKKYGLTLHYVDIDWDATICLLDEIMQHKGAPVHSIEPQIARASLQAKADGVEMMVVGESADLVFGGMDGLLAKDWTFDEFVNRYTFLDPAVVLLEPADVSYLFERYRVPDDRIDYLSFMNDVFAIESSSSYFNAFGMTEMPYVDPYAGLIMKDPLDLDRVRNGDSKYLIRDLYRMKYPELLVPEKVPMPRPVDTYFLKWGGPVRQEFKSGLDMGSFTGNQKWQLYCLERFLDMLDA